MPLVGGVRRVFYYSLVFYRAASRRVAAILLTAPLLFGGSAGSARSCGALASAVRAATVDSRLKADPPHAAVARVIVDDGGGGFSFGSGVLVDARERFGLVVTNWHVVRDAKGPIEVLFADGFRSQARALKVDEDWDLAALVVWRPSAHPAPISQQAPRPGEELTICGYGPGTYRSATGRCTQYYAPGPQLPEHVVELDVQARQGDSGGPIFNSRGEVAGILFGASQGTTLGSFGGRVKSFLDPLAPGIGEPTSSASIDLRTSSGWRPANAENREGPSASDRTSKACGEPGGACPSTPPGEACVSMAAPRERPGTPTLPPTPPTLPTPTWTSFVKNCLAVIGAAAVLRGLLRWAR